ncbi:DnaB-like helicase C-terminal domain-containing protein [Clostridium sporogenes]|uniref:DnaB-like helicase C-terminal domain-containing protein n=1 Tax=Clostridium sporogenes TaxID=1509 RepID=UPI00024BA9CB|nr:DnaB-like helicase C-terminal domain-containing protein [Clostridium sporogenes]EHN13113.1 TOPRIM domain protein [Clostridium sporogenes PA 3679]MDU4597901.1 DnaB-like helicase C-terminal domain-containing protein [Clostridium sporogenes]NFQ35075.1 toprim domain-containing protein [Clostridium sporogenes]NFQ60903.1 toprim domain-containing protein [Clostridium sporogenes]NFU11252.1 toprim domain-containing protein [Clostridium sporogenes]
MEIKEVIDEIKSNISSEEVKSNISRDLALNFKNNKCLCFLHDEKHPSMSFDNKNKRFKCFSCGKTYDIFDHYQQYKHMNFIQAIESIIKDYSLYIDYEPFKSERRAIKKATEYKQNINAILPYLELRKISKDTAKYVGLKAHDNNIVFEYKNELGEHIANKYRKAGNATKGCKMWFEAGTNINTLFNMDKVDMTKPLVITEGELDCLALIESGHKNSVSVPTGANSYEWVEVNYSWLEQFKEVILWFDNDKAGIEGMSVIAPRIPADIVKTVNSNKAKDINEILYKFGKQTVLKELKKAKEADIENIEDIGNIPDFDINEAEKIRTGIKEFDKVMHGFVLGSVNVLTGYNGAGKSTIINQMCIAEPIRQGFKTFIFSGELTRPNLIYWLTQTMVIKDQMISLKNKEGREYSKASDKAKEMIRNYLNNKLFIYSNDFDTSKTTILETMNKLAKRKNVKCFVLDNLMTIDLECKESEELNAQKQFIRDLKKFAIKYNAVIHIVAHPRKPNEKNAIVTKYDVCGSGDITNLSDYVIAMHRYTDEQKEKGKHDFDGALMLFKNRPTGKICEKGIGLYFSQKRKRFYRQDSDLNKDYGYTKGYEFIEVEGECPF